MDYSEAPDVLEIMAVKRNECPHRRCGEPLEHFSGLENIPEFLYCPKCNDIGYDLDGCRVARIE